MEIFEHNQNGDFPREREKKIDDKFMEHHSPTSKSFGNLNLLSLAAFIEGAQMRTEQLDRLRGGRTAAFKQGSQFFHL